MPSILDLTVPVPVHIQSGDNPWPQELNRCVLICRHLTLFMGSQRDLQRDFCLLAIALETPVGGQSIFCQEPWASADHRLKSTDLND